MGGFLFAAILGTTASAAMLLTARLPMAARWPARCASVLLAAPALAYGLMPFIPAFQSAAPVTVWLVAALAPALFAFAALRVFDCAPPRWIAAGFLMCTALAGLLAAVTDFVSPVLLTLVIACGVIISLMLRHRQGRIALQGVVGALAFPAGIFAFLHNEADGRCLLFFACGILGLMLALARASHKAVEAMRDLRQDGAIAR